MCGLLHIKLLNIIKYKNNLAIGKVIFIFILNTSLQNKVPKHPHDAAVKN